MDAMHQPIMNTEWITSLKQFAEIHQPLAGQLAYARLHRLLPIRNTGI
jgi:hypothetical protein